MAKFIDFRKGIEGVKWRILSSFPRGYKALLKNRFYSFNSTELSLNLVKYSF